MEVLDGASQEVDYFVNELVEELFRDSNETEGFRRVVVILHIVSEPLELKKDNEIIKEFIRAFEKNVEDFSEIFELNKPALFSLLSAETDSKKYSQIKSNFLASMNFKTTIHKIFEVMNPYLLVQFELKKQRKREIYVDILKTVSTIPNPEILYHGTADENKGAIAKFNFDWRRFGRARGSRFGQGVSFARRSTYASHYPCDLDGAKPRVMFVAAVLVVDKVKGHGGLVIPPEGYDTSTSIKPGEDVLVKFEDADFIPKYCVIYDRLGRKRQYVSLDDLDF